MKVRLKGSTNPSLIVCSIFVQMRNVNRIKVLLVFIAFLAMGFSASAQKDEKPEVVYKGCQVFVPNAFTPNGDGRNEIYRISNPFAIDLISFEIYDRWGSRVFATENALDGWDGNFKGQQMNPGVLLYRIRFRCDGQEEIAFGSFTLIR